MLWFHLILQIGKKLGLIKNRFSNPSTRSIMSGLLLVPGPVATIRSVQGLSRVFNNAANKPKFLSAANKLQEAGLGTLVTMPRVPHSPTVFIKKPLEEIQELLLLKENEDLCTVEEYAARFKMMPPSTVPLKLQETLVGQEIVPEHYFVNRSVGVAQSTEPHDVHLS